MEDISNPKLKLAIARMLPERIDIFWRNDEPFFLWKREDPDVGDAFVLETEWLYIVSLVEQTLNEQERNKYRWSIQQGFLPETYSAQELLLFATFNQRATAFCKVKGIDYGNVY